MVVATVTVPFAVHRSTGQGLGATGTRQRRLRASRVLPLVIGLSTDLLLKARKKGRSDLVDLPSIVKCG